MKYLYLIIFFLVISFSYGQKDNANLSIEGFKLYPNPVTNGKVFVNSDENSAKKILIFDVLGTKVLETTILNKELNLADLDAGVYVIRVYEKDRVASRKLIIK